MAEGTAATLFVISFVDVFLNRKLRTMVPIMKEADVRRVPLGLAEISNGR